ncbi:MAG TPA: XRE family transcriptional regulator [Cyanobacteria bacterium UBA12227]|nr:XRE family transcriptional regulator [Cyanobacteria bacterium UBA12227]HAX88354.1 XRE family transcriptional regulator [Cyanobacteria bacterium UBA11370]HBY77867.1 XRE family transcriptional regulator [Cyanobacteria bacterium UBA11148]
MSRRDNSRGARKSQPGAFQLEITGLDIPLVQEGKKRLRKPTGQLHAKTPLFTHRSIEMTATGAPVISATQAFLKTPDWHEYSAGRLYFQRRFGKGRYIEFYILNQQKHQPGFITSFAEQEILEQYGVHATRLHALFATYAVQQQQPWLDSFTLLGSDLIKMLHLHRGNKLKKSQKLKAVADLACILGTLGAKIQWQEGNLNLTIIERSPVWIVSVEEYYQNDLFGNPDELFEVAIQVQPGPWTRNFLNKEGERENKALYQYGFINKAIFDLDPHRQELAPALALYLIQNRRAHPNGKYSIRSLVSAVMSTQEIEAIGRDRRRRSRFVKQVYRLLESLTEIQFGIQFDPSFPEALRPSWAILPNEKDGEIDPVATAPKNNRMPDGFFTDWLNGVVTITTPTDVEVALKEFEHRKARIAKKVSEKRNSTKLQETNDTSTHSPEKPALEPCTHSTKVTGAALKQARQSKGWTQAHLASLIGKSVSWVKLAEGGLRRIKEDDQVALQEILDLL